MNKSICDICKKNLEPRNERLEDTCEYCPEPLYNKPKMERCQKKHEAFQRLFPNYKQNKPQSSNTETNQNSNTLEKSNESNGKNNTLNYLVGFGVLAAIIGALEDCIGILPKIKEIIKITDSAGKYF